MPKKELSIAVIEELKNKGYSQSEIARMYGVSRQAVSWHKINYGGHRTPREMINDHFPWIVPTELCQTSPYKRMRDHGEYMATGGKGMARYKLDRLRAWYRKLREDNVVVEYDPRIPPEPGVSNRGGFAYRDRRQTDGDLLVRVNEYTELTEEGRRIWRFPPRDPE